MRKRQLWLVVRMALIAVVLTATAVNFLGVTPGVDTPVAEARSCVVGQERRQREQEEEGAEAGRRPRR